MHVDLKQLAAGNSDEESMNAVTPIQLRATTHACARYAQRVLGMDVGELHVHNDPALRGRCERGIARLLERAQQRATAEGGQLWIAGTRALVIANAHVVTLIVASHRKGFSKKFFRRFAESRKAA
jgi:hypothetical protein